MITAEAHGESTGTGVATFGAGCFWCVEAVFQEIDGAIIAKQKELFAEIDRGSAVFWY